MPCVKRVERHGTVVDQSLFAGAPDADAEYARSLEGGKVIRTSNT